jgi:hypothetical protein
MRSIVSPRKLARAWVDPLGVLEDHQERLPRRQPLELLEQDLAGSLPPAFGADLGWRSAPAGRDRQKRRQEQNRLLDLLGAQSQYCLNFRELYTGRIGVLDSGGSRHLFEHRVECAPAVEGRTLVAQPNVGFACQSVEQTQRDPRLADAWLAREQHGLSCAVPGLLPASQ